MDSPPVDTAQWMKPDSSIESLSIPEVLQMFATRPEGLSESEAEERYRRCGPNSIHVTRSRRTLLKFFANFTHLMALLLWASSLLALFAGMPQLCVAILLVNVINGLFSFWQEHKAERATEALRRMLPSYATVLRGGEILRLNAEALVPGDIMILAEGDRISADARLLQDSGLRVDQSPLTGESQHVRKSREPISKTGMTRIELPSLVFAGTGVVSGNGRAVAIATGMGTELGRIAQFTQSLQEEPSPLQKEMTRITRVVSVLAVGIGIVFFLMAHFLAGIGLTEGFILAVGMIVAFVPEGLLPTVTLSLAMGVQRMAKRNALIKRLSAVETLGCTTVICTDKTGTLTQNEMTVRELWAAGERYSVTGIGYAPQGKILPDGTRVSSRHDELFGGSALRRLLVAGALCNNARLVPPEDSSERWGILGDPTEAALKVAALKGGVDLDEVGDSMPRLWELPFDSRRKRMSTIHELRPESGGEPVGMVFVKGSPKEVTALCSHVQKEEPEPLSEELRVEILNVNDEYARAGLRVLAVACRPLPRPMNRMENRSSPDDVERDLVFLGLAAMLDPPRQEVSEAVEKCFTAGIRIIMMTGDYGLTAESVARRIGITRNNTPRILSGSDLDAMAEDELREALREEVIFARVAPEHKLRVVTALKGLGHVVAVTGDGVNDAPALKKADIGIAMGLSGTDVARETADMILSDDNFASIVNAIEEGRTVYSNIRKFVTLIFTSNAGEACPFFFFALSQGRIPLALTVMQILSIDLGTDVVPSLALGAEPPEQGIMERPPRDLKDHVITPSLLARAFLWLGPIQGLAAMAAFYFVFWTNGHQGQWLDLPSEGPLYRSATSMALACVISTQIGNILAQRSERLSAFRANPFKNPLIWIGISVALLFITTVVYTPALQEIFGTEPFPAGNWLFLAACSPLLLIVDEVRKALVRRAGKHSGS